MAEGISDAISFGRPFISNPDLVERNRSGAALAKGDEGTFYSGGARGYVDYPRLEEAEAA
jgi:N-ethylmaleimide reductase